MEYQAVIGLEVHAQLKTRTKIFCGCSTAFGAPPNQNTCPVCLGMPGVLPVLNRQVVEYAMLMAMATGCEIERVSRFARKNYFYPDLPKGYQISQYELPIARHGYVDIAVDGQTRRIGLTRIHMEEDAGKLVHDPHRPVSQVDYNRTGVPLIEIVSEPDLRSPEQAGDYLRKLRAIVRYLGICDGNMEEGSFRCDANVSIRPQGSQTLGTRAELKNLNSFRFVEKALHFEIHRQIELLRDGGKVVQETRLYDADKNRTFSMRGKEEAHDYRYFPDPDLLPVNVDAAWMDAIRAQLPELPDARHKRLVDQLQIAPADADRLTASRETADFFEACLKVHPHPKTVCNWVLGPLLAWCNSHQQTIEQTQVSADRLAELLKLVDKGTISANMAKEVFEQMAASGDAPGDIVQQRGLAQLSDESELESMVDRILADHPDEVQAFHGGKGKLMGFFVGQVMRASRGSANPKLVNQILRKKLAR